MRNGRRLLSSVLSCALVGNLLYPSAYATEAEVETPKVAHSDYVEALIADWKANNNIPRPEKNIYGSGLDGASIVGYALNLSTAESAGKVVYLKDTEAQPNDGICDRDIIQELISAAPYGTVILFEEGQYDLILPEGDSTANALVLKDGVSLVGAGMSDIENTTGTRLKLDATANTASTVRFMYGQGVTHFTISDMTLDSKFTGEYPDASQPAALQATISGRNSGEMTHGIYLDASGDNPSEFITIENVSVETFRTYAINIRNTNNVVIRGCAFQYATNMGGGGAGYGVAIQGTTDTDRHGLYYDSYHNVVEECMILGPVLRHGILIQYYSHNNLIHNNLLYGTGYGAIDMHGEEEYLNEISYNVIDNIYHGGGVEVGNSGSGHHRTGPLTYVHHNTISNSRRGIDVEFGTHDTIVEHNTISNSTGGLQPLDGSSGTGIRLRHSYRTIIRDNDISGDFKYGIVLESHWGYTYNDSTNDGGSLANFGGGIPHQADVYNNTVNHSGSLAYNIYANEDGKEHTNQYQYTYSSSAYHDNQYDTLVEEGSPYFIAPYYIGTGRDNTIDVDVSAYIVNSEDEMLMPEETATTADTLTGTSTNAYLIALVLETAEASFTHPFFPEYEEHSLNTTKSTLELTPYASAHKISSLSVNGKTIASGATATVELEYGENIIEIDIVAEDGVNQRRYTLIANYLDNFNTLASISSATASHESGEGNEASNVLNGNLYSYWRADLSESANGTSDLIVELVDETPISHVQVAWYEGTSYGMDFKLYTSMDGEQWTEVYDAVNRTGYTEGYVTYVLDEVTNAMFVKLEVSKLTEFDPEDINNALRLANKTQYEDQVSVRGIRVMTGGVPMVDVVPEDDMTPEEDTTPEDDTVVTPDEDSNTRDLVHRGSNGVAVNGTITGYGLGGSTVTAEVEVPSSALGETGKVSLLVPVSGLNLANTAVIYVTDKDGVRNLVNSTVITDESLYMNLNNGGTMVIEDNRKAFTDLTKEHWFMDEVNFVTSRELFVGTAKGVFSPDMSLNHAMLLTVLYSFDGAKVETEGTEWYAAPLAWAESIGIFEDYTLLGEVTREEMVTMLYRYATQYALNGLDTQADLSDFTDAEAVSEDSLSAVKWAVANGILQGDDTGAINPDSVVTRGEAATFFTGFALTCFSL